MPGSVPYTSTMAPANATLSYGLRIAENGLENEAKADRGIANAINVYDGKCTYMGVAEVFGLEYTDIYSLM